MLHPTLSRFRASLVQPREVQLGSEPACSARDLAQPLCWEDPLEKGMVTHSSILAWRIPWTIYTVHGVAKSWTQLSNFQLADLLLF